MTPTPVIRITCSAALALAAGSALAQTPNPSFNLIGHIERFALTAPGDPLSAATMTVRGIPVTLPRSLLVTMPGQYMTAQDLFRGPQGGSTVQNASGLALADAPPPRVAFEAELQGNIVGGQYIAGVARINQGALHVGNGVIQAIDGAAGELRVGAPGAAVGARVRLNDPKGIYGQANGAGAKAALPLDQRFQLDPDNSPVHARTGFPVCIPRAAGDARCPAGNRPAAPADKRFTCGAVRAEPLAPALAGCDARLPAPLRVGDHVAYVGMLQPDGAGGFIVAAHGLEAELGIYTSPGAEPVYLYIEEALMGTLGEIFPDLQQEETSRVRVVGFTTDPSRPVEVRLIDSGRNETGTTLTGPAGLPPSNGPQFGRFRNTWPAKDNARAVRRDLQARVIGSPNAELANGLTSGLYVAPIGEYIGPEATRFGVPGHQPPMPFENFCFLAKGGGTSETGAGVQNLARLDPFPESGHADSQPVGSGPARACDAPN
ncbi:hypothetical protein [Ottowia sp.]|uniref:hypothetical protein n=1 Tax=Ottowia sp. TaxID=1898956 RepID=UPI002CBB3C4F|nr:hypothetical protein [Ottowia sp.]